MISRFLSGLISPVLLMTFLTMNSQAGAIDCPSQVAGSLSPLYEGSSLRWAAELTGGGGVIANRQLVNRIAILALDFEIAKGHSIYFEGANKWWNRLDADSADNDAWNTVLDHGLGFREFFYNYSDDNSDFELGLKSLMLGDYFLLDDRVLGAQYSGSYGPLSLTATMGTVQQDFARMGRFCGKHKFYFMSKGSRSSFTLGETNLAGVVLKYYPGKEFPIAAEPADGDEFQDAGDEFGDTGNEFVNAGDEFSDTGDEFDDATDEFEDAYDEFTDNTDSDAEEDDGPGILRELGLIYYQEFGDGFSEYKYYYGAMAGFDLPGELTFNTELVGQYITDMQTLAFYADLSRMFRMGAAGRTMLSGTLMSKIDIDDDAVFYTAFSNMYLGRTLTLGVRDMPLYAFSVKHFFPWKVKLRLELRTVQQFTADHFQQYEARLVLRPWHFMKFIASYGYVESRPLDEHFNWGRLEFRLTI